MQNEEVTGAETGAPGGGLAWGGLGSGPEERREFEVTKSDTGRIFLSRWGGRRAVCDPAPPVGLHTEKEQGRAEDATGRSKGLLRSALLLK